MTGDQDGRRPVARSRLLPLGLAAVVVCFLLVFTFVLLPAMGPQ